MKKLRDLCQEIISIGSESRMEVFCSRCKEFETLLNRWKNKEYLSHTYRNIR